MAEKTATRTSQYPLVATFEWNFDDTMANISGVDYTLGADAAVDIIASAQSFDIINLPVNSIVTGGHVAVTTAFDAATYTAIIGDSVTANRYLASTDVKAVGTTALLTPGYKNTGGLPIRVSLAAADACTTGTARITIEYIIADRATELNAH